MKSPQWFGIGDGAIIFMDRFFIPHHILRKWFIISKYMKPTELVIFPPKIERGAENDYHTFLPCPYPDNYNSWYLTDLSVGLIVCNLRHSMKYKNGAHPLMVDIWTKKAHLLHELMYLANNGFIVWPDISAIVERLGPDSHVDEDYLDTLNMAERWALYFHVLKTFAPEICTQMDKLDVELLHERRALEKIYREGEGIVLRKAAVVGMTTTGASKYNDLLKEMNSKIRK